MKFKILLLFYLIFAIKTYSQVLISQNPNGTPHASSQLEVRSKERGFLPPVMSTQERRAIVSPVEGLMVYDSTKQLMCVYTKLGWQCFNMTLDSYGVSNGVALPNPGVGPNTYLGNSVEVYKDHAYLGAFAHDEPGKVDVGAVFMFQYKNDEWKFAKKIIAPDGLAGDHFGSEISAIDSFVFISAYSASLGENIQQGAVYIYKWIDTSLVYQSKITGSNATSGDRFGTDIKASGNLLVVGAPMDDIGINAKQGAIYFFELVNGNWVEKQKYFATANVSSNNFMGKGIAIDSNVVVVGCEYLNIQGQYGINRNRVSVFNRTNEGTWALSTEIVNPTGLNGEAFGYATTLVDNILTISSPMRDGLANNNKDRGVVYVYQKNGSNWNLIQTLSPPDSSVSDLYGDYFGASMDRSGNYLVVGAHFEDFGSGQNDFGGAYLYEWNGSQFVQLKKIRSIAPQVRENFGIGVAIHNGKIVIGASGKNSFTGTGYFFYVE